MAQKRLRDYQSPLGSFLHNIINLGMHFPGRFAGFDTLVVTGQLQFSLAHTASGVNTLDATGNPYGPIGAMMSNQGEVILEDAPIIALTIATNAGNTNTRVDTVVLNHQYLQLANPQNATYSVVIGSLVNDSVLGALSQTQVVVGYISIPPGATLISQCTYVKAKCPDSGDQPDAKLNSPNNFTVMNAFAADPNAYTQNTTIVSDDPNTTPCNLWDVNGNNGNTFRLAPTVLYDVDLIRVKNIPNQDGMEITLVINRYVRIKAGMPIGPTASKGGYLPIQFSNRLATVTVAAGNNLYNAMSPPADDTALWFITMVRLQGFWYVKAVDGPGFSPQVFLQGMCVEVHMPIATAPNYFDTTGLGINDWLGWALCNGNIFNGYQTLDHRGRVGIGAINVPNVGAPSLSPNIVPIGKTTLTEGDSGGEAAHTLIQGELPNIKLRIIVDPTQATGAYYVYDTGGSADNFSLKGDNANSAQDGAITTEPMGSGNAHNVVQPYIVVMFAVKL